MNILVKKIKKINVNEIKYQSSEIYCLSFSFRMKRTAAEVSVEKHTLNKMTFILTDVLCDLNLECCNRNITEIIYSQPFFINSSKQGLN